ncbi:MAG TPA: hypothetical protein VH835_16220 [Dongiaceae bacterium]
MGSWGTGIYQNDAGLDVRGTYRDLRKLGFRGGDLAEIVLESCGAASPPESEDDIVAHLALADLLWRDGLLPADMQEAALRLIKSPALIERWDDAKSRRQQQAVLDKLAQQLAAPQRAKPAPAKPPYIEQCDFEIGEVLAYPWPEGAWTLLKVIAWFTRFRGKSPICEVLEWDKAALPTAAEIAGIPFRKQKDVPVIGAARPEQTVAELIALKRLPPGAAWKDYEDQMVAPHIPIIRIADRDPHFQKVKRLGMKAPSQRPFLNHWFVATNAWTTWKDLPNRLQNYWWPEDPESA